MVSRQTLLAVALVAWLFAPSSASSDEVDDLKAVFEQATKALNSRNLDALAAVWHDQMVSFGLLSPFAADGKAANQHGFQMVLDNFERETFTPINPQFRVIGTTGIAWGQYAETLKPKDGPISFVFGRYTLTYTKSEGKWLVVAAHFSRLPSGN